MFKDIIQFYKIGKKLGLSRKEINKIFIFNNTEHRTLYTILSIIGIILFGAVIIILGIFIARNVYPEGTLYSTVKEKDFKYKTKKKV